MELGPQAKWSGFSIYCTAKILTVWLGPAPPRAWPWAQETCTGRGYFIGAERGKWALGVSHSSVKASAHDLGQFLGLSATPASQAVVWMRQGCEFRVIIAFPRDPARSRHPCIPVHTALCPQPLGGKRALLQRKFLVCGERGKLQKPPCSLLVLQVAAS